MADTVTRGDVGRLAARFVQWGRGRVRVWERGSYPLHSLLRVDYGLLGGLKCKYVTCIGSIDYCTNLQQTSDSARCQVTSEKAAHL